MAAVVVHHERPRDRNGDPTGPEPTPDAVEGCQVAPQASVERTDLQDIVDTRVVLYGPSGMTVVPTDSLDLPGYAGRWQVDGSADRWDLADPDAGVVIVLRQVT